MNRTSLSWISVVLYLICFICSNILVDTNLTNARLDLTQDKIYTISTATKQVLGEIKEPIKLRFYASASIEDMGPDYTSLKTRIDDLLGEYIRISKGLIIVETLNPKKYSIEEDLAVSDGVRSIPNVNKSSQIFLGLSGRNSTNGRYAISHFAPERAAFLEYDLTRLIYDLSNTKKRIVGIYGDLPLNGDKTQRLPAWMVVDTIERFYETQTLFGTIEKFSDEIDVLLLAEPGELDTTTVYAIDQFVMRGGRILVFVDPFSEILNASTGNGPQPPRRTSLATLKPLLKSWGVDITERQIIGDLAGALKVQMKKGDRIIATEYPAWFDVQKENFIQNEIITSNLSILSFRTAGHLQKRAGTTVDWQPIVWSSTKAGIIDVSQVEYAPDPTEILSSLKTTEHKFTLVARIRGSLDTAFSDGPPRELIDKTIRDQHRANTEKSAAIIIVSDTDFLSDSTWAETKNLGGQALKVPFSNNGDLVLNALDQLTGSSAMMGLRGRGVSKRRFEIIDNMEREAEQKYRSKEKMLVSRIKENENLIKNIQKTELKKGITFTKEHQKNIDNAREEMLQLRMELRQVQFSLREDIEALKWFLSVLNIWGIPSLICLIVLSLISVRAYRGKHLIVNKL
jgi:ABC-type uncharacterized transport system involved in gliding motility auxiliary subunit